MRSVVLLISAAVVATAASGSLPLRQVARVPLSGPAVRFDYTSIDPTTHTLWISHMDANQLIAFDVVHRRITRIISAPGVHGVIAVSRLRRVYASATNAREVLTINSRTGAVLARTPAGEYPDGLAYDAALLADVQTRTDIAVIDPKTNRIIKRIHVPNCVNDHGLLIDAPRRLAFVACDGNAKLLTLSLKTMSFTGTFTVAQSPDVLALDPTRRRLYVSAESGVVSVFAETTTSARPLGIAFLAKEAHTVAVDPATHLVYFPLQSGSNGQPQLLIMRPT